MNNSKKIIVALVVLSIGFVFVNNFLFSLPEGSCNCFWEQEVQSACDGTCAGYGGCMYFSKFGGFCVGEMCHMSWKLQCETGSWIYYYTYHYCPGCNEW